MGAGPDILSGDRRQRGPRPSCGPNQLHCGRDHQIGAVGLDDVTGTPRDLVSHVSGRERTVSLFPRAGDRLVRRAVETRFLARRPEHDDRQSGHVGGAKLGLGCRPVEVLDTGHEIPQLLSALFVLGSKVAEERMDPIDLEIDAEAIDEDEAGDIGPVAVREDARVDLTERMPDGDEWRRLAGDLQEVVQIVGRVGDGVAPASVARPATRPVVGAGARGGRHPVVHGRPAGDAVTHPGLEDDRRRPRAPTIEVQRPPAEVDALTLPDGDRSEPVARKPCPGTADTGDIDEECQDQPDHDREQQTRRLAKDGHAPYRSGMCRSIKTLRRPGEVATTGELEAAARQFVRKLSGYREPSARNQDAFDAAIQEVAAASRRLVEAIGVDVEVGPDRWKPGSGTARTRPRALA